MKRIMILAGLVACMTAAAQKKGEAAESEMLRKMLKANISLVSGTRSVADCKWNPHATFKGVALKHLVTGADTEGRLSCHIVRIEPGCVLDTHSHDGKMELHEVIAGSGTMYLDGKTIAYTVGQICVIPANTPHKVVAGKDGMYLLAKFAPALL